MSKRPRYYGIDSSISSLLLKSREKFAAQFSSEKEVHILLAQAKFDQAALSGFLPLDVAHKILNTPKDFDDFLKAAEKEYLKSKEGDVAQIRKDVAFKSTLTSGIISGLIVGALFYFLPATQRPTVEDAFKAVAKEISEIKASVQRLEAAPAKINVYNFNFGRREEPQPEPIDKKAQPQSQNRPYI